MAALSDIYETLVQLSSAYEPLTFWRGLPIDEDCRMMSGSPVRILDQLQESFADEDLLGAGVAVEQSDRLRLVAGLRQRHSAFLALRRNPGQPPYEILTQSGALIGTFPLCEMRDDARTNLLAECRPQLYVVFDIKDLMVCRRAGLAATLATGLSNLTFAEYRRILTRVRASDADSSIVHDGDCRAIRDSVIPAGCVNSVDRVDDCDEAASVSVTPDETVEKTDVAVDVVFVAWSPATLSADRPPGLRQAIERMHYLARNFDVDLSSHAIWEPPLEQVSRIRAQLDGDCVDMAVATLRRSAVEDLIMLLSEEQSTIVLADTYVDVVARLSELSHATANTDDSELLDVELQKLRAAIDREFVAPVFRWAGQQRDPLKRNMVAAFGYVAQFLHEQMPLRSAGVRGRQVNRTCRKREHDTDENVSGMLNAAGTLVRLYRELQQ